ncbi:hypothetical protein TPHA_0H03130 [Tetrapisispora phaffii CBS 4417]|uniref:Uncharacterized protein n=1 Tax=Tetrapisispora phaffii (strain ATCC 24235 / CBS 4417 / NBRC 1672 / NRRL Y-8282 / UCD 70-5) TaxID=1071381 RepID=G8BWR5_TETPH|nr:hypothetical protein TPHA_0H03130 [Tetrapisispora phaffii CBS 4417]CCE64516.1 hypothetical protein TPHA_0H03130 [Tetrapisispora phaffii CBS 4417]
MGKQLLSRLNKNIDIVKTNLQEMNNHSELKSKQKLFGRGGSYIFTYYSNVIAIVFIVLMILSLPVRQADAYVIEKRSFPLYNSIATAVSGIYGYYNYDQPIWVRIAWWGSFYADDGGVLDSVESVKNVCKQCVADKQDPNMDCTQAALDLSRALMKTLVLAAVGYGATHSTNGAIDGSGILNKRDKYLVQSSHTIIKQNR